MRATCGECVQLAESACILRRVRSDIIWAVAASQGSERPRAEAVVRAGQGGRCVLGRAGQSDAAELGTATPETLAADATSKREAEGCGGATSQRGRACVVGPGCSGEAAGQHRAHTAGQRGLVGARPGWSASSPRCGPTTTLAGLRGRGTSPPDDEPVGGPSGGRGGPPLGGMDLAPHSFETYPNHATAL